MGLLDGMTSGLYRYTLDGRRVYAPSVMPFQRTFPLVSDEVQPVVNRRARHAVAVLFFLIIPLVGFGSSRFTLSILIAIVLASITRWWIVRGLPRAAVARGQLKAVTWRERWVASSQATGERVLWALLAGSIVMFALVLTTLVKKLDSGAWPVLFPFSAMVALFGWQIYLIRSTQDETKE